jgi:hypothetical protein
MEVTMTEKKEEGLAFAINMRKLLEAKTLLAVGFASFARDSIPEDCTAQQFAEARTIFFAGAKWLWFALAELSNEEDFEGQDYFNMVKEEIDEFVKGYRDIHSLRRQQ